MLEDNRMILVGITTEQESENYISTIKRNNRVLDRYHFMYIKETNIQNIKNIKFDVLVINRKFHDEVMLNSILKNSKFIILNGDMENNAQLFEGIRSSVITYGFNSKSTVTLSSITEDFALICIQRNIISSTEEIEQQEIRIKKHTNSIIYDIMSITTVIILYNKNDLNQIKF